MKRPVFSARYWRIAALSKIASGSPPPAGSWSTIAGMRLFGDSSRNAGENCSPRPMFTGFTVYGRPHSSSMMLIFQPFGVGQ